MNQVTSFSSPWHLFPSPDVNQQFADAYPWHDEKQKQEYLNDSQLDVNYKDGLFLTWAAEDNDGKMLEKLLEKGATAGLSSALSAAAYAGHDECVELLMEHGADPECLRGTSAFDNHHFIHLLLVQKISENEAKSKQDTASINKLQIHPTPHGTHNNEGQRLAEKTKTPQNTQKDITSAASPIKKDAISHIPPRVKLSTKTVQTQCFQSIKEVKEFCNALEGQIKPLKTIKSLTLPLSASYTKKDIDLLTTTLSPHITALNIKLTGSQKCTRYLDNFLQMPSLTELALSAKKRSEAKAYFQASPTDNLQKLTYSLNYLHEKFCPPKNLQKLKLTNLKMEIFGAIHFEEMQQLQQLILTNIDPQIELHGLTKSKKLQQLTLDTIALSSSIDFSQWKNLQKLKLKEIANLSSLAGIGQLQNLQKLTLIDLPTIKELPQEMEQLSALWKLKIDGVTLPDRVRHQLPSSCHIEELR